MSSLDWVDLFYGGGGNGIFSQHQLPDDKDEFKWIQDFQTRVL